MTHNERSRYTLGSCTGRHKNVGRIYSMFDIASEFVAENYRVKRFLADPVVRMKAVLGGFKERLNADGFEETKDIDSLTEGIGFSRFGGVISTVSGTRKRRSHPDTRLCEARTVWIYTMRKKNCRPRQ